MMNNLAVHTIAAESTETVVREFFESLPDELSNSLPQEFFADLNIDLQADIYASLKSRLQWAVQSAYAELSAQQQEQKQPESIPKLNYLPPQPLQELPTSRKTHSTIVKPIHPPIVANKPTDQESENCNNSYDMDEPYLTLNKSTNRQRRRRRRSAAAEYQESLLNATS